MVATKIPFFSVIIPVYNRYTPLVSALESALLQTFEGFEVLIVDDGSDSSIAMKIDRLTLKLNDPRITVIRHRNNINGAAARNTGIDAATGQHICFLDSDDYWLKQKLERIYDHLKNLKLKEGDKFLLHHQYCNVTNNIKSEPFPFTAKKTDESVAHYSFVTNNVGGIQSSTICIPAFLAKTSRFEETFIGHQDWDFVLKIGALTSNFIFIPESLALRGKDSVDSVAEQLDWKYSLWFYSKMSTYFESKPALYYFKRVILTKALFSLHVFPIFCNRLFLRIILSSPISSLIVCKSFLASHFSLKKRLENTSEFCNISKCRKIIIWGANAYGKTLISYLSPRYTVVSIIDSKASEQRDEFMGIKLIRIQSFKLYRASGRRYYYISNR